MTIKKVLQLFFLIIGILFSAGCVMFVTSKTFRAFVTKKFLKMAQRHSHKSTFTDDFLCAIQGGEIVESEDLFAKMGSLLDSYDTQGGTPEIKAELCKLYDELQDYYAHLRHTSASQKKLDSVDYQIKCIKTVIGSDLPMPKKETMA